MYMNAAFDNVCFKGSVFSQSARFVYLCLCKHADNTNQTCFPSLNRIAQIVGKSISTIKRAVRELCKYGAIERTPRFRKDGGQTSNLYKISECNLEQFTLDKAEEQALDSSDDQTLQEVPLSLTEYTPAAQACMEETREGGAETVESQVEDMDLTDINDLADKGCPEVNGIDNADRMTAIKKGNVNKSAFLDYVSRFKACFKRLSSKLHNLRPHKFHKNEPGGGHE